MASVAHGDPGCSRPPSLTPADFNYGADEYDAEGNEEPKALPEGSETMPYIDESPTMSPQLSARGQESGDGVSPTPADGLGTGVGARGSGGPARLSAVLVVLCDLGGLCPPARFLLAVAVWAPGSSSSGDAMPVGHAVSLPRGATPVAEPGGDGLAGERGPGAGARPGCWKRGVPGWCPAPGAPGDGAQRLRRAAGSI